MESNEALGDKRYSKPSEEGQIYMDVEPTKWIYSHQALEYRESIPNDMERRRKQYLPREVVDALKAYPTVNKTYLQQFDQRMGSDNVICPDHAQLQCQNRLSGRFCPRTHHELDYASVWLINERRFPNAGERAMKLDTRDLKRSFKVPCEDYFYRGGCKFTGRDLEDHLRSRSHDPKDLLVIVRKFFQFQLGDHVFEGLKAVLKRE
ncbi:MAG: hypothetical protein M1831_005489 [Alyxoria varia]|nr:MAG: hypothetical protein M1831_005489 [Alyxoria varia]